MNARILPDSWLRLPRETRDAVLKMLIDRQRLKGDGEGAELARADRSGPLPASLEQSFFLEQQLRFGGQLAWTIAAPPIILDDVDVDKVRAAITTLASLHDMLHTVFRKSGTGFELRLDKTRQPPFSTRKLPLTVALTGAENWVRRHYEEMLAEPFDAETGPLWRAELCTFASRGVILLAFCSAIVDGDSLYRIDHELRSLLAAPQGQALPELPFDYADYAFTQAEMLRNRKFDPALAWWRERLAGGPPASWNDGRGPIAPSHLYEQVIGTATGRALDIYSAVHRTTPPVVLLAELMALLHRLDGQDDIWVASATASRDIAGTETMVGTFARQVLLRLAWPAAEDPLARVHSLLIKAMDQQAVPHLLIKQSLEESYPDRPSAFRYVFNYRELPVAPGSEPETEDMPFRQGASRAASGREEDILFLVMQSGEQRQIHWYLREDRFTPGEARRLMADFKNALDRRLGT